MPATIHRALERRPAFQLHVVNKDRQQIPMDKILLSSPSLRSLDYTVYMRTSSQHTESELHALSAACSYVFFLHLSHTTMMKQCGVCSEQFASKTALAKHTGKNKPSCKCPKCNMPFCSNDSTERHRVRASFQKSRRHVTG
jgi:hypothetical protein